MNPNDTNPNDAPDPGDLASPRAGHGNKSMRFDSGLLPQTGALVAAVAASACCWLPLTLIAFGVSGGTLAARFEAWRPVLFPVTFALLGLAFYFTYRKPKSAFKPEGGTPATGDACCALENSGPADQPCCPPSGTTGFPLKKLNKVMLWVVTPFVLAFAFFPNYVGYLITGGDTLAARKDLDKVIVNIEDMTCEACAAKIEKSLRAVPGVEAADVDYTSGRALVGVLKGAEVPRQAILAAISKAGNYKGRFEDQVTWTLAIGGMTCEGCASGLQATLSQLPGVSSASVSYERRQATVSAAPSVEGDALRKTVSEAGYTLTSANKE